jgi:CRISPR-associated protein Csa3
MPSCKKKAAGASETTSRSRGVASLDELVLLLDSKIKKGTDSFVSERSRLSHHLRNFESMGLVTKNKNGKNVEVRLTGLGEMFV